MRCLLLFSLPLLIFARISDDENKRLKSECGKPYIPGSPTAPWLYPIKIENTDGYSSIVFGVAISPREIFIHAPSLLANFTFPLDVTDEQAAVHMVFESQSGAALEYSNDPLEFSSLVYLGHWGDYIDGRLNGILWFQINESEPFTNSPICLPRNLDNKEEMRMSKESTTTFDVNFPLVAGKKFVIGQYDASFTTNAPAISIAVNEYEGRTYLVGFTFVRPGYARHFDLLPITKYLEKICQSTGVCPIPNFKPISLLPPTTTTTTTTKAPTPKPKPVVRKTTKQRRPIFEYDDDDLIPFPEDEENEANVKDTVLLVAVVVYLMFMT